VAPLTPERLVFELRAAGDPAIAPDGRWVAFVLADARPGQRRSTSNIWLVDTASGQLRQLTRASARDALPRFAPDSRTLAFVSDRSGEPALYLLPLDGGEPRELLRRKRPIVDLAWSPDGSKLAFVSPWAPDDDPARPAEAPPPVRVTRRIDYKQDNRGYLGDLRHHVFVVDVATGEESRLTSLLQDHNFPRWAPDGRCLAVQVANRNGMCSQLAVVDAESGSATIIGPELGNVGTWAWSPDGGRIVYTGDTEQTWQADVWLWERSTGAVRRVTHDLPVLPDAGFPTVQAPSMPVWLDDRRVLFHAIRAGASGHYVIDVETAELTAERTFQGLAAGFATDASARWVVQSFTSFERTGDLLLCDRWTGDQRFLTDLNGALLRETPPARWERFEVERDGLAIEAWLLFPPDFDPSLRYPLVLDVHGGPNGYYGWAFNAWQQLLATNGFLVLYANPRGSSSYGREFTLKVLRDWGGEDYRDLMAVLDRVLERPYVDPARIGIWGYSYGGYMTAWAISQSDRFAAAVCGAPCFDLESMYGTSDIGHHFGEIQWGGPPWVAREWYQAHSPATFAHRTRTPTLIIHGEADERCPIGQGEQMFVTLLKAGCEVEFARYPDGSHLFLRVGYPDHRCDAYRRLLDWFHCHLGGPQPAGAPGE